MTSIRCRRTESGSLARISPSSSLAGFDGVSSLPFNLLVPSFQCSVSRCCRTRSSANSFLAMIEDFRLVSVSPHLQPFEPSPTDALCLSFNAHDESNDVMQRQFPGPAKLAAAVAHFSAATSTFAGNPPDQPTLANDQVMRQSEHALPSRVESMSAAEVGDSCRGHFTGSRNQRLIR